MNITETLHALGVRDDTLTAQEKDRLDTVGYLPIPGTLSATEIAGISGAMQDVYANEKTGLEGGPAEASYMQNKAPASTFIYRNRACSPRSPMYFFMVCTAVLIRPAASGKIYMSTTMALCRLSLIMRLPIRCGC